MQPKGAPFGEPRAGDPLEGEVLPPRGRPPGSRGQTAEQARLQDESLDYLAALLDDIFRIPGTRIRFGLDPIVGLVPGAGDLLAAVAAAVIIFSGWRRGLARITLARMAANLAIDTVLGSIPVAGNVFDVFWKANRRNYRLLERERGQPGRRQTWRDWAFLGVLLGILGAAAALPLLVFLWFLRLLLG
jgi:hypothetical protein